MNVKSFLSLVEIRTKVASQLPLFIGTSYALYKFNTFSIRSFILFFISLLFIDMTTTALNHFYDFKKAKKQYGYNYDIHNPINNYELSDKTVISVIITLLIIAIISGIFLFLNTDLLVLILGGLSFFVGITYSFGPVPISRTPLGEVFSGFFMGFIIFFIAVHIHLADGQKIISVVLNNYNVVLEIDIIRLIKIFMVSLPLVLGISNIMLANNISDIEDDKKNDRYTLPIYIGKKRSLTLFKFLYFAVYIDILLLTLFNIIPIISLIVILTFLPVYQNINRFMEKQSKKSTFHVSIKNFLWLNLAYLSSFIIYFIF